MNIEHHLRKIERLKNSLSKLDDIEDDYEAIIELSMLICAHCINAAMHKLGTLKQDRDIKHNKLFGFLENHLGKGTEIAKDFIEKLEDLRPSHVYGKGENGNTALKAEEYREAIEKICKKILEVSSI